MLPNKYPSHARSTKSQKHSSRAYFSRQTSSRKGVSQGLTVMLMSGLVALTEVIFSV